MKTALTAVALWALAGCNMVMWRTLDNTGQNQVVRVESGDRLFFELEENATTGYLWTAKSDDADVEVKLEHIAADGSDGRCGAPGKVKVELRVHRGYDGPSAITFAYQRPWEDKPIRSFVITLFRRTGDAAFWK